MTANKIIKKHYPPKWPILERLFPPLDQKIIKILNIFPEVLQEVWPLSKAHKKSLPNDIHELSLILTRQRHELRQPYWSRPALISAYLYYFLPWNIIRLSRLFLSINLPHPKVIKNKIPILFDAGSGPLTLPLALWTAKTDWRATPLHVLALDSSRHPMELGRKIFMALGKKLNEPIWTTKLVQGPLNILPRHINSFGQNFFPWLIATANTLNEFRQFERGTHHNISQNDNGGEKYLDERFIPLLESWEAFWLNPTFAGMLFIEPGTRLGGDTIMELRRNLLELGHHAISPCGHDKNCPLQNNVSCKNSSLANAWCHFTFSAEPIPQWLAKLSTDAGLYKKSLSLAFLFAGNKSAEPKKSQYIKARTISQIFPVEEKPSRYACASCGLALLPNSKDLISGTLTLAKFTDKREYDKKSGAVILEPVELGD